jgi:hypothetical protein
MRATGIDRMNWPIALLMAAMLAILARIAKRAYQFDPPVRGDCDGHLVGIRGWLIVLAIALAVGCIALVTLLVEVVPLTAVDTWSRLTTFGTDSYNAFWAPLILFQLVMAIGRLTLLALLAVVFFQRRTSFSWFVVLYLGWNCLSFTIQTVLMRQIPVIPLKPQDYQGLIETYLGCAMWIAYVLRSRRVKSTFVKRWRGNGE